MKLMTAMPVCMAKLGNPSAKMELMNRGSGFMQRKRRCMGASFTPMKYHSTAMQESAWPANDANALPTMPHPNKMTKK